MRYLKLVIKTDSYVGNFERELLGYVFENYIYLKRFGTLASSTNEVKLLSVELKRDKEMVKKYV